LRADFFGRADRNCRALEAGTRSVTLLLIDSLWSGVIPTESQRGNFLFLLRRSIQTSRLRTLRGFLAACVMIAYVLAGALHGVCDLDVTNPAAGSEIASVLGDKSGHSEQKGISEHHCHGCFSVAVPQPVLSVANFELSSSPNWPLAKDCVGLTPDTESPPPKHLT
jgi:hypothetical protein